MKILGMLLVATLCGACTTPLRGLEAAPGFSPGALQEGGLVIAGVVSSVDDLPLGRHAYYADLLRRSLREKRNDLRILTADAVADALGEDGYEDFLREYRDLGMPNAKRLRVLASRIDAARYLVLARIDRNDTSRWTTEESVTDKKGKKTGTKIHYRSGRTVDLSMRIVDLETSDTVWNGSLEKSSWNENVEEIPFEADGGHGRRKNFGKEARDALIVGLAAGALAAVVGESPLANDAPDDPYPDPPNETYLFEQAFSGFAENLPTNRKKGLF